MFRLTFADQQWLDIKLCQQNGNLDYRFHTSGNCIPYLPPLNNTAFLCALLKRHGDSHLPDAISQIAEYDWCLAAAVAIETHCALPPVNATADKIDVVTLTVMAGDNAIYLTQKIPMSGWVSILSGRPYLIADSYKVGRKTFDCKWRFDDGELTIEGKDGMRLFNDKVDCLWHMNGWRFGPVNLPTLLLTRQNELREQRLEREKAEVADELRQEDYAQFLARLDAILKNIRQRRRVEGTLTWREALELYEEKLGSEAPLWVRPLTPARVLFPSVAIRILMTAVKAKKVLPMNFYSPSCAFVPAKDLDKDYVANYEMLQVKLRLSPDKVTRDDLPDNTTEADLPYVATEGVTSWPLDPLRNASGEIEAYWLPCVKLDTDNTQPAFVDAFRRGDREALKVLDPDGLLRFDRSDRSWLKTTYGKTFLAQHAVSLATLNAKLTAALKAGNEHRTEVLRLQEEILAVYQAERENAARSEAPYPYFELDSIWLELNAIDRNRPDDAAFWSFRLPEGPVINVGDTFDDRFCAATIDDYAINVCDELRTAVNSFKRLLLAAETLPVELPLTTTEAFLTKIGIDFEAQNIRHGYASWHRKVGWIDETKKKTLKKAAAQAIRECRTAFGDLDRQDLLKRIGKHSRSRPTRRTTDRNGQKDETHRAQFRTRTHAFIGPVNEQQKDD